MDIFQMLLFPLTGSGSGTYADALSRYLLRRGHTVRMLCCDRQPQQRAYPVETITFGAADAELDFDFPAFTTHPASTGVTFGSLSAAQRAAYIGAFDQHIRAGLARARPDLVHAHHGWVIGATLAELDVPYLVSLHGTEHYGFQHYPAYRALALRGLRRAWLVLALTEPQRQQAIEVYRLPPERIQVVRSGTDTTVFRPIPLDRAALLARYGISDAGRPIVLFVGKLTAIKGADLLLRAAAIYQHDTPAPLTLIVGDGDQRQELAALSETLALEHIHFLGNQPHPQVVELLNAADLVALPSRMDWFPLAPIEALACGTPVIASDCGGFPQIVAPSVGTLVPTDDPLALAAAISAALASGLKARVGPAAVAHVRQNLSWDQTMDTIVGFYQLALRLGPPAAAHDV